MAALIVVDVAQARHDTLRDLPVPVHGCLSHRSDAHAHNTASGECCRTTSDRRAVCAAVLFGVVWCAVNLPYYQCHYNPEVDCGERGCADAAIQNYTAQLADASSTRIPRNESLKYVVHFIGDIHQPLHAGNRNDSNGNSLTALWFNGVVYPFDRNTTNLHSIWDTGIIETRMQRDFGNDFGRYFEVGCRD